MKVWFEFCHKTHEIIKINLVKCDNGYLYHQYICSGEKDDFIEPFSGKLKHSYFFKDIITLQSFMEIYIDNYIEDIEQMVTLIMDGDTVFSCDCSNNFNFIHIKKMLDLVYNIKKYDRYNLKHLCYTNFTKDDINEYRNNPRSRNIFN